MSETPDQPADPPIKRPAKPRAIKPPRKPLSPRRRKQIRWLLRIAGGLTMLLAIFVVLVVHYTRPANLKPLLEKILSHESGGNVRLGGARLSWRGELFIDKIWLDVPGVPAERGEFARLLQTESLMIDFDFSKLCLGELKVQNIQIERPELYIVEDLDAGRLNLEMLRLPEDAGSDDGLKLTLPPSVQINGARVRFTQIDDGQVKTLDTMRLEGELQENPNQERLYDFALRQYNDAAQVDATLNGSFDAEAPAFHVSLEGFQVDTAHRQLIPAGFRSLWDQLQPTGRLPNLSLTMDADDGRLRLSEAVLELEGVAITPPYAEFGRPDMGQDADTPYSPRMTQVNGRFVLGPDNARVENLTGFIEGVRYYASGTWGFADDTPGTITVSTDPFILDEEPRFLASLPMVGLQIFNRLQPSGKFQASTTFERRGNGDPVIVRGVIKLLDAKARYHKFAYPIDNMQGVISFDHERVLLSNLTGNGPNGGTVTLRGEVSPPRDGAAVRISVAIRDVPLDEHVMNAFSEKRREAVEMFFDAQAYQQLIDDGVIRSAKTLSSASESVDNDQAEPPSVAREEGPPTFDLGGLLNIDVLIDRPFGKTSKYAVTTAIDAAGASVLFRHWPYPMTGKSGKIIARPGGITLEQVVLESPTGGQGLLAGELREVVKGQPPRPELRIQGADLPIDDLLLHSIPAKSRQTVLDLHPTGRLTGTAAVTQSESDRDPRWRVDAKIVDGVIQPFGGDYRLDALSGGIELSNDGLTIKRVTGQRGAATLGVDGRFNWARDNNAYRLQVTGRTLDLDPALLDLIPPQEPIREKLATLYDQHQPVGIVNGSLLLDKPSTAPPLTADSALPPSSPADTTHHEPFNPAVVTHTLEVQPLSLALDYREDRLEFSDITGTLVFHNDHIQVDQLGVAFDTGTTEVDGIVGLDGVTPTALNLLATANATCPYTRKFLPTPVIEVLDALEFTGDYRLTEARLLHRPAPSSADETALELDAKVALVDAQLKLGVPITELHGSLETRVRRFDHESRPRLTFDLRADRLRVADRLVSPLTLSMANDVHPDYLTFDPVLGGVYGGVMVGSGSVPLEKNGRYRFDLTLSDVAVDPFLKPQSVAARQGEQSLLLASLSAGESQATDDPPVPFSNLDRDLSSGLLSASLSVESPLDDVNERRGRGAMVITDANLYNRPLGTALLRASNLTLPSSEPIDSASARYLIDGDTLRFDELTFDGPGLTIAGAGTMNIPDTRLNLIMVSRNNRAPRLGPVSDLLDLFKDELIAIKVTGTLESPKTGVTGLQSLQDGWRDIFGTTRAVLNAGKELDPDQK